MTDALAALVPIFVLIALGAALKRAKFAPDAFWTGADRLTYYVFFPALLFRSLATASLADLPVGDAVFATIVSLLIVTALSFSARRLFALKPPAYTSVLQGSIRPNTYVALAAAVALYEDAGLSAFAIGILAFVPLVNLISVLALARWGRGGARKMSGLRATLFQVVTNPLILACALGVLANLFFGELPAPIDETLALLGRAALPLGLVSVGAGLRLEALRRARGAVFAAALGKLVLLPAVLIFVMNNLHLQGTLAGVILLFGAAPAAVSAYILARQMGGDHRLMAAIITAETILAIVTLPFWMWAKDWFI